MKWKHKNPCFPNLAMRMPDKDRMPLLSKEERAKLDELLASCDSNVRAELTIAGLNPDDCAMEAFRSMGGEVPTKYIGEHKPSRWGFRRAWYYYVAEGPGIPPDRAQAFWVAWGNEVRTDGNCECPSPLEQHRGFAVGLYHIDTQAGLNAFIQMLDRIAIPKAVQP